MPASNPSVPPARRYASDRYPPPRRTYATVDTEDETHAAEDERYPVVEAPEYCTHQQERSHTHLPTTANGTEKGVLFWHRTDQCMATAAKNLPGKNVQHKAEGPEQKHKMDLLHKG